ncbi:hypothetical protein D7151_06365 [Vibrio cholerae]|nr:hypothetical protein [Vibrio cholerae]
MKDTFACKKEMLFDGGKDTMKPWSVVESTPVIQRGGRRFALLRVVVHSLCALSARHQKDKTQRMRLARLSPRLVVASSARKCCYPLRLLKLLLWLGRAKGVFSGARVLMIT